MGKSKKENKSKAKNLGKNVDSSENKTPEKKQQKVKNIADAVEADLVVPASKPSLTELKAKQQAVQKSKSKSKNNSIQSTDAKENGNEASKDQPKQEKKNKKKLNKKLEKDSTTEEEPKTPDAKENRTVASTDEAKQEKKNKKKLNKKLKKDSAKKEQPNKTLASPGQTLFVGNVPSNTKKVQLIKLFSPFGKVLSARVRTADGKVIFKHKMRKESSALTAYVVLESVEAASKALELNGTLLKDHHLRVQKAEKVQQNANPKCTVFIGNLKATCTDDSLHQIFSSCGEIDYVRTLRSSEQKGGCNGTAFICFKNPEAVGLALELEGTILDDRPIHVERYSPSKLGAKEKRTSENNAGFNNKNKKGTGKVKGGKPLEKAAAEFRNKKFDGKKPQGDKNEEGKKKKSEYRGVKVDGIKKKPKKKVPSQQKRLANKIAPKE